MLHQGNKVKWHEKLVLWVLWAKGINSGGQEMIQDLEELEFW